MTTVSVAMATFNGARFLEAQLESLASQRRMPDELVVYDDGSTDATLDILESFARRAPFAVSVTCNERRLGWMENFIMALGGCQGEVVAWSDQDDVWHPDKLARCAPILTGDSRVGLVVHAEQQVDGNLRHLGYEGPRRRRWFDAGRSGRLALIGHRMVISGRVLRVVPPASWPGPGVGPIPFATDNWAGTVASALGRVELLSDRLVLHRRHESTVTAGPVPLSARISRPFSDLSKSEFFGAWAKEFARRAAYLDGLRPSADELGDGSRTGLERSVAAHQRLAQSYARRAAAYREGVVTRAWCFGRNAAQGDYRSRSSSGLGPLSLARDLTIGLRPRR
jgi:glycosyltransferase involved in cell wall biosynthesis